MLLKPAPMHEPLYHQAPNESQPAGSVHTPEVLPFRAGPVQKRRYSEGAVRGGRCTEAPTEEDRLRALCLVSPRSQPLLTSSLLTLPLLTLHQLQTAQTPQEDNEGKEECPPKGVVGPPEGAQATHEDDHACITLLLKLRASTGIRCHQASPNAPTPLTVSASSCGERSITGHAAGGWSACDRLGSPVGHSLVVGGETDGRIMGRMDGRKGSLVGGQIETAAALSPTHSARSQAQTGPASPGTRTCSEGVDSGGDMHMLGSKPSIALTGFRGVCGSSELSCVLDRCLCGRYEDRVTILRQS